MLTDSVDAFWLFLSMRSGLPATVLLGAATLYAIFKASMTAGKMRSADAESVVGVVIVLIVMTVLGFSVSFFGGVLIWFFMVLGLTVSLIRDPAPAPRAAPPMHRGRLLHSRGLRTS